MPFIITLPPFPCTYLVLLGTFTLLTFVISCYVRCRRRTYNLVKNFADSLFTSSHWSPTPRGLFILCVPFLMLCVLHCVILPGPLIIVQRCEVHLSYLDMGSINRFWACCFIIVLVVVFCSDNSYFIQGTHVPVIHCV